MVRTTPNGQYAKVRHQFKRWRARNQLSLKAAQKLIGINYRTLLRFESGKGEVMATTYLRLTEFLISQPWIKNGAKK